MLHLKSFEKCPGKEWVLGNVSSCCEVIPAGPLRQFGDRESYGPSWSLQGWAPDLPLAPSSCTA